MKRMAADAARLIFILLIEPAYLLLKGKRWREIATYLGMGILAAQPYYVWQVDYIGGEGTPYHVGNQLFYLKESGYPAGYYVFPVYSEEPGRVEALGETMRDGFRRKQ